MKSNGAAGLDLTGAAAVQAATVIKPMQAGGASAHSLFRNLSRQIACRPAGARFRAGRPPTVSI